MQVTGAGRRSCVNGGLLVLTLLLVIPAPLLARQHAPQLTAGARVRAENWPWFDGTGPANARSGVACADCHMPYTRIGAMKVSDHWVRSPLLNMANACQTCHRWTEAELEARVHTIQDRTYELRNIAIDATLQLARAIGTAAARDSGHAYLAAARQYQRKAQFFTDFVEAENSMGFHADQEAARILGRAIDYARLGLAALYGTPLPENQDHRPSWAADGHAARAAVKCSFVASTPERAIHYPAGRPTEEIPNRVSSPCG
jgi:nitrite reductase (cytochrome c-552)